MQSVTAGGQEIAADGVFILREAIAPAALVPGLAVQNGSIVTNADGETNIRNIFAAGDATGKPLQIAKAVAEGQRTALFIAENRL